MTKTVIFDTDEERVITYKEYTQLNLVITLTKDGKLITSNSRYVVIMYDI